jgi:hypothetical protein
MVMVRVRVGDRVNGRVNVGVRVTDRVRVGAMVRVDVGGQCWN